jgi:hypothetical protein
VQLEGISQLKNGMTSGIEDAAFRLETQWLNRLRYRVPSKNMVTLQNLFCCFVVTDEPLHSGVEADNFRLLC